MSEESGYTSTDKRSASRYTLEFGSSMALFLVLFLLLPRWVPAAPGSAGAIVLAVLPIVPVIWMPIAVSRFVGRMDERLQVLMCRSLSIGFAVAMVTAILVALLGRAGVEVGGAEWYVFIAGMLSWGVSIPLVMLRAERPRTA
ncbi:hypothetical protein [Microbacterium sp. No. 7]|uniref:hypothetical protein n=1 Tax=Microbacterium sp. No. 7 TaxID=1714373 RepID=UPI0006D0FD56|nr:hypothetical protein [Microbacterium sp. No. 7]ALJ19725.1 hypothetical protein AOA12_07330 [Microbacterium sp. No. 7]